MDAAQSDASGHLTKDRGWSRSVVFLCIALVLTTVVVYLQTGEHRFLNFDDDTYVTDNRHVTHGITAQGLLWAVTSVEEANWHPLTWISHMADVQLFGMNPRGHHLSSVAIHATNTLLLFLLLVRLTAARWSSAFVAVLFALHPLHVESVAWVAERKDVLSALFGFITLHLYTAYVTKQQQSLYILSLSAFALGLMSKPMLVTLPVVMLLLDYWPLERFRDNTTHEAGRAVALVKEKIPFLACALGSGIITIYAQQMSGAMTTLLAIPIQLRCKNALLAYVTYIGKTVWPRNLAVYYPFPADIPLWQALGAFLLLSLATIATIRSRRRYPYLMAGWFWFLITLAPVIGIMQVGAQSMADRYTYLPLIGLFIMVAWGIPDLLKRVRQRPVILALLAAMAITAVTTLTWLQLGYWHDSISLYRHTIEVTSNNRLAHYNLGVALAAHNEPDAAIREYRETLRITPSDADAHSALGVMLINRGELAAAIRELQEAIRFRPDFMSAHNNLGIALSKNGHPQAAIREFREALRLKPDFAEAHNNLGVAMSNNDEPDQAIREIREAIRINPDFAEAHNSLGGMLASRGELDGAIREFRETLRLAPDHVKAFENLGLALARKRITTETRK